MSSSQPGGADPISWRAIREDMPVATSDGENVGHVSEVLGSQDEDIFHGIEVHLGQAGHRVFVRADDVDQMTSSGVTLALTSDEVQALPEHTEERAFALGMTGLFRKHVGWVKEKDWK